MSVSSFSSKLDRALDQRSDLFDIEHHCAIRLFNGFTEGCPELVIDLYADAAVFHNYADPPEHADGLIRTALESLRRRLPWLRSALVKSKAGASDQMRRGIQILGGEMPGRIREHGIWYAVNLTLHQDCTLYLDTRMLRKWAMDHLADKMVLNAFAYTGSLGVAAVGGGARRAVNLDRNRRFLDLAQASYVLNGFRVNTADFVVADFFRESARLRRRKQEFDCVFLDPPFFSSTSAGVVDQQRAAARLINKVRPLVSRGGQLVAVNNAVYVSGASYMRELEALCRDGYLEIEELIPVPDDFIGRDGGQVPAWMSDPAPFNHSTKIVVMKVL